MQLLATNYTKIRLENPLEHIWKGLKLFEKLAILSLLKIRVVEKLLYVTYVYFRKWRSKEIVEVEKQAFFMAENKTYNKDIQPKNWPKPFMWILNETSAFDPNLKILDRKIIMTLILLLLSIIHIIVQHIKMYKTMYVMKTPNP